MRTKSTKTEEREIERRDFKKRIAKIYYKIPEDFLEQTIKRTPEGKSWKASRIINVRYDRTVDLEILAVLEKITNEK